MVWISPMWFCGGRTGSNACPQIQNRPVELSGVPGSPAWAVQEWLVVRPSGPGPFLKHEDGSALSRFQFGSIFQKCLVAAGLSSQNYSSHSFRIGAAMEAARWGLDDRLVRQIIRWESGRFRLYVRPHSL